MAEEVQPRRTSTISQCPSRTNESGGTAYDHRSRIVQVRRVRKFADDRETGPHWLLADAWTAGCFVRRTCPHGHVLHHAMEPWPGFEDIADDSVDGY